MTSKGPNEPAGEHSEDVVKAGKTRRGVVRAAGAGALALGLGGATAAAAQASTAAARKASGSLSPPPKHFVLDEAPKQLLAALIPFLTA